MDDSATLADRVIHDTLRNRSITKLVVKRPAEQIRSAIMQARRFVLDDDMSSFLADLATAPFRANPDRRSDVLTSLRHGARLPHSKIWIEYGAKPFRQRLLNLGVDPGEKRVSDGKVIEEPHDAFGKPLVDVEQIPDRIGFLCEEHPRVPTAVRVREFMHDKRHKDIGTIDWEWVYQVTDDPLPWNADTNSGMFGHGITPHICPQIGIVHEREIPDKFKVPVKVGDRLKFTASKIVIELTGTLRYLFAFLATLNDIPVVQSVVRPQKGFIAKGSYRKFLEHTVIRLQIPQRIDKTRLALKLVVMARRRAHQVRGHWRTLAHQVLVPCQLHDWQVDSEMHQHCRDCGVKRTWIHEHQRGDASLGFVTHEYSIGRNKETA